MRLAGRIWATVGSLCVPPTWARSMQHGDTQLGEQAALQLPQTFTVGRCVVLADIDRPTVRALQADPVDFHKILVAREHDLRPLTRPLRARVPCVTVTDHTKALMPYHQYQLKAQTSTQAPNTRYERCPTIRHFFWTTGKHWPGQTTLKGMSAEWQNNES